MATQPKRGSNGHLLLATPTQLEDSNDLRTRFIYCWLTHAHFAGLLFFPPLRHIPCNAHILTSPSPHLPFLVSVFSPREREGERKRKKKIPHLFKIHIFRSYILDMRERETNSCEVRFSTGGDGFHFVVIFFPHLHRFSRSNALSGFDRSRPLHQKVKVACSVLLIA